MISIIPKPTDTPSDNSTGMVIDELRREHARFEMIDLDLIDPFNSRLENSLIWACGLRQEEHQFETLQALSIVNRVINSPSAIATCASKVHTSALLLRQGIRHPLRPVLRHREKLRNPSSPKEARQFISPCTAMTATGSYSSHQQVNSGHPLTISRNMCPMTVISAYLSSMVQQSEQSKGSLTALHTISTRADVAGRAR